MEALRFLLRAWAIHRGSDGSCSACPSGKRPDVARAYCEACPPGRAGRGGICKHCNAFLGLSANKDQTQCTCPAGTYDSFALSVGTNSMQAMTVPAHIFCWSHGKLMNGNNTRYRDDPEGLNSISDSHLQQVPARKCIACPSCVTCNPEGKITINSGFALASSFHKLSSEQDVDIFSCKMTGKDGSACLRVPLANSTVGNCGRHRHGLLCASCEADYVLGADDVGCHKCGTVRSLLFPACLE